MTKKIHIGKMISQAAYKSGYTIIKISELVGISRRSVYNDFEKEFLDNDTILKYGKALGIDFSFQIPELLKYSIIKNDNEDYLSQKQYREKYYNLLEKHIIMIEELEKFKKEKESITYKKSSKIPAPSESSASKVRQKSKRK